jgi:hypothetical protein
VTSTRRPGDAALIYARRGWPVFPCHHPTAGRCGCSCGFPGCASPAKHPRVAGGLNAATRDEGQIAAWWRRWPRSNVAIRTGSESGLVVLDIDPRHGGNETLAHVQADHGRLPSGRTIRTGSGGQHRYFRHPGFAVRNDAGRVVGAGVDLRGDGGYVIAPPSRHRSGGLYAVEARAADLPELPDWLLATLEPPRRSAVPQPPSNPRSAAAWGHAALEGELGRLQQAKEGARNDTLNRVAFRLGQIVGAGCLNEVDIEPLLIRRGIAIGLREREVVKTVRSGLHAGEGSPHGPTRSEIEP